jgi:hypothetical protein
VSDERLERLAWERTNHARNAAAWRLQADRIRRAGRDPGDLLDAIEDAERRAAELAQEIVDLLAAEKAERQQAATRQYADQAVELGPRLPSTGEK